MELLWYLTGNTEKRPRLIGIDHFSCLHKDILLKSFSCFLTHTTSTPTDTNNNNYNNDEMARNELQSLNVN